MKNTHKEFPKLTVNGNVYTATVLGYIENKGCRVHTDILDKEIWVDIAVLDYMPEVGDSVLIVEASNGMCYITGVLQASASSKNENQCIEMQCGANAKLVRESGNEKIQIKSKHGCLLFEYTADSKKMTVYASEGDLQLCAKGNINFIAGKKMRFTGNSQITMQTPGLLNLRSGGAKEKKGSDLLLTPNHLLLNSENLNIKTTTGHVSARAMRYQGNQLDGNLGKTRFVVDKVEFVFGQVIERTKNVYRTIEKLLEVKAGRMRTIVNGTNEIKGKRLRIYGDDSVKIQGDKIHLG